MLTTRALGFLVLVAALTAFVACGGGGTTEEVVPDDQTGDPSGDPPGEQPPAEQSAFLLEDFTDTTNVDAVESNADWGVGELSVLRNAATTSRHAYAYSYPLTDNGGLNSGRGEYVEITEPMTGEDLAVSAPTPLVAEGRRVQWTFSDTLIGAAGTITSVAWGPVENRTVAASYPNVRLRMGYQAAGEIALGATLSENFEGDPTVVYDGPYDVEENANVGNTSGEPTTSHVGSYPQNVGCSGAAGAPGGHNAGLFAYTGWYPWPALTTPFGWDPGNPSVADDRRLVFDASVEAGDFTQRIRGWFAVTYPCSGILIAGWPETRVTSTYEGDGADPQYDFGAGIVNPEPSTADMCFTITQLVSVGQSLFLDGAFGDDTDYDTVALSPAAQSGHAVVALQYQGADAVEADRKTIDTSQPFTDWTSDIDDCDGMKHIRFRILLTPDPVSNARARIDSVRIRMTD